VRIPLAHRRVITLAKGTPHVFSQSLDPTPPSRHDLSHVSRSSLQHTLWRGVHMMDVRFPRQRPTGACQLFGQCTSLCLALPFPTQPTIGPRYSQSCQFGLPKEFARTQKYMRLQNDTPNIVYGLVPAFGCQSPLDKLGEFRRRARRDPQRFEGLRQTRPDIFPQGRSDELRKSMPSYCFLRVVSMTGPIDLLSRGCHMEAFGTPKHCPVPRYHYQSLSAHFGTDAWRSPDGLRHEKPKRGSA